MIVSGRSSASFASFLSFTGATHTDGESAAALENILLAARGRNLGTVWCGMHPIEDRVRPIRELLQVPEDINILGLVVVGHPAQPFKEADRFDPAKVHHDRW